MDLCGLVPSLNLYNRRWPIRTASYPDPSAKFTFDEGGHAGEATGSIVSGGCILSGGIVRGSVLGRGVNVKGQSLIEDSIVLDNCIVGRQCKIRRAILDENLSIRDGESIGYDPERDSLLSDPVWLAFPPAQQPDMLKPWRCRRLEPDRWKRRCVAGPARPSR